MKRQAALVLTLLVVFIAFAIPSHATSDAYFCTSKGYLAYEPHDGGAPGVVGHVLRVVRFEPKRGIYLAGEVTLLEFTVYHLMCSEDRIEISGWCDIFTKYVIEIAGSGEVRSLGPTEYPGRQWSDAAKDEPAPANLGIFGPHVAPLPLESLDPSTSTNFSATSTADKLNKAGNGTASLNSCSLTQRGLSCSVLCFMRAGE
jgi:hypothetical protein